MKRPAHWLFLLCVWASLTSLTAQTKFSNPGRLTFSAGIGILPTYMKDKSVHNALPAHFMMGYRASKKFNLSAFAGYATAKTDPRFFGDGFSTYIENKTFALGLRGEMRHELTQRLEVYGGTMFGYHSANIREFYSGTTQLYSRDNDAPTPYNPKLPKGNVLYSAFVGTTYYIFKGFGVYGELGYGVSLLNVGTTFRI